VREASGICELDIEIAKRLKQRLEALLKMDQSKFEDLYKNSEQCTEENVHYQVDQMRLVPTHICSELEYYKLAQIAWPDAKTFLDIGANRGYLAGIMFSIWGGNGHGLAPSQIYGVHEKKRLFTGNKNEHGYCKTGLNRGYALYCQGTRDEFGSCNYRKEGMRVHSIDGSAFLTKQSNKVITTLGAEDKWSFRNFAMSDTIGVARFVVQNETHQPGFEGGAILKGFAAYTVATEEVQMITVDEYVKRNGISQLDLLKVDAEGNDLNVIWGARNTLRTQKVAVITWENSVKRIAYGAKVFDMLEESGYACYATAFSHLYKLTDKCLAGKYLKKRGGTDWGNVFCISKRVAPLAVVAFDALSIPVLQQYKYMATSDQIMDSGSFIRRPGRKRAKRAKRNKVKVTD
jgi:FkbM family methyltransferase